MTSLKHVGPWLTTWVKSLSIVEFDWIQVSQSKKLRVKRLLWAAAQHLITLMSFLGLEGLTLKLLLSL